MVTMSEQDESQTERTPDSINQLVIVGEFGYLDVGGPWEVEKSGTNWAVIIPYEDIESDTPAPSSHHEGCGAVLIADFEVVGGGVVDTVYDPEDEGETHVIVDQYAMGGRDAE